LKYTKILISYNSFIESACSHITKERTMLISIESSTYDLHDLDFEFQYFKLCLLDRKFNI